jgi:TolB protein
MKAHMKRYIFVLAVLVCLPAALAVTPDSSSEQGWQTYIDGTYKVMLRCPAEWKPDPSYNDRLYLGTERRLNSIARGFFQGLVEGDESSTPEQSCKGLAEHVVRPFGGNPTIRRMKVDGQSACLVWPSKDQGAPWDAEVVIKYPTPVEIDGERYSLLGVDADKDYILAIIRTLKFMTSTREKPPFSLDVAPSTNAKQLGTATWKADSPISITLTVKNNSRQILQFGFGDPAADYQFTIVDLPSHQREIETDDFQELQRERKGGSASTRNGITLKPQESYQKTVEISSLYQLDRPGNYTIQAQMALPEELGKGLVRSNTIKITVAK